MGELIAIGVLAGLIAGISPCILPVLPVILVVGATGPTTDAPVGWWRLRARPVAVVAGLIASFSILILAGSEIISALHLPAQTLRDAGIALLVLVGAGFVIRPLGELLERPFAHLSARVPTGGSGGFLLGLGLGVLFVPCAGPILAAVTVAGASEKVGAQAVFLTIAFAVGAAIPLLVVALAGSALTQRVQVLRRGAPRVRQVAGVVMVVMALAIGFNTFAGLQRSVPGYTNALQNHFENGANIRKKLSAVAGTATKANATLTSCSTSMSMALLDCGQAPPFTKITAWLNTPGGKPLTLAELRGKVVLVDFWTYSCINCQRTFPHLKAWYQQYAKDGFVIVGVHTPEFSFEHVVSNVKSETANFGIKWPVAIDNDYGTWDAYNNDSWPADYLIDATGQVRHVSIGEGDYSNTESLIRQLLVDAHPGLALPKAIEVPDQTPSGQMSPETYIGYDREQFLVNPVAARDQRMEYQFPAQVPLGGLAYSGWWTEHAEEATAGGQSEMALAFLAGDVYLVMGGHGTVQVSLGGAPTKSIQVTGVPKLYTLYSGTQRTGLLNLKFSPGIEAYDFTFG